MRPDPGSRLGARLVQRTTSELGQLGVGRVNPVLDRAEIDEHSVWSRTDDAAKAMPVVGHQIVSRELLDGCRRGCGLVEGATGYGASCNGRGQVRHHHQYAACGPVRAHRRLRNRQRVDFARSACRTARQDGVCPRLSGQCPTSGRSERLTSCRCRRTCTLGRGSGCQDLRTARRTVFAVLANQAAAVRGAGKVSSTSVVSAGRASSAAVVVAAMRCLRVLTGRDRCRRSGYPGGSHRGWSAPPG